MSVLKQKGEIAMNKLDFKKTEKNLYLPSSEPTEILVPEMTFLMVDGRGDPNEPDGAYTAAVGVLYALVYTIKMNKTGPGAPVGYADYVVPPLEGLWWYEDGGPFRFGEKDRFCWTAMIRQPEFVTPEVFTGACREAARKKPELDVSGVRLAAFDEGLCVQCMHVGPYDAEPATVAKMEVYMRSAGFVQDFSETRRHHEIYLNAPLRTDARKLRTVVRHPVKRTV